MLLDPLSSHPQLTTKTVIYDMLVLIFEICDQSLIRAHDYYYFKS